VACLYASIAAAAVDPFYADLYQRGMAHFASGEFAPAAKDLRLAAFGSVDVPEQFETAHIYAAIAASKSGQDADVRTSVQRVYAAERIQRTYALLKLPESVRKNFDALARTALTANELAYLQSNAPAPPRTMPQVVTHPIPGGTHPQPTADPPPAQPAGTAADAEKAIAAGQLGTARSIYESMLESPQLTHTDLLKIGEGLYRVRDFTAATRAFGRAGTFEKGEEGDRYYYAVALFETGQNAAAKRELAAALPHIEITSDVAQYRTKIQEAKE
jgi:tetratricopeptide (TPR) repeat protein